MPVSSAAAPGTPRGPAGRCHPGGRPRSCPPPGLCPTAADRLGASTTPGAVSGLAAFWARRAGRQRAVPAALDARVPREETLSFPGHAQSPRLSRARSGMPPTAWMACSSMSPISIQTTLYRHAWVLCWRPSLTWRIFCPCGCASPPTPTWKRASSVHRGSSQASVPLSLQALPSRP
jgi:hypothetical protein